MGSYRLFFRYFPCILASVITFTPYALADGNYKTKPAVISSTSFLEHPLFNTPYKVAANYSPVLGLRALAESKTYKEKRKANISRTYFHKSNLKTPYAKANIKLSVEDPSILSRTVKAHGEISYLGSEKTTVKVFNLDYLNEMKFSIFKKADMKIQAFLNRKLALDLKVHSEAGDMTNKVSGTFLGRKTDYKTKWRDTKGTLAGYSYEVYAMGEEYTDEKFTGFRFESKGDIQGSAISGSGKELHKGYYEFEESYGPIVVKTTVEVYD